MIKRMTIVVSPYSKRRTDGKPNAKNYPWWNEVLTDMSKDFDIIQLLYGDEPEVVCEVTGSPSPIGVARNGAFRKVEQLLKLSDGFMCVDNFLQHLAHYIGVRGVVLFGPSDPGIFGYRENLNLSTGKYRPFQFQTWQECEFNPDAFASPETVITEATKFFLGGAECANSEVAAGSPHIA